MDKKQLLATLSMLAFTLGGAATSSQAAVNKPSVNNTQAMFDNLQCTPGKTVEECACEAALKINTIDALEEFLRRYPPNKHAPNACSALATTALNGFAPTEGGDGGDVKPPTGGTPY